MPLKSVGIIFCIQLLLASIFYLIGINKATLFIMLMQCMAMMGYYIGVLKNDFWNIVLEDSKGLFADFSLLPTFLFFYLAEL